jgi:cell division protein ZapA
MSEAAVQLKVAGQTYQVVTSAPESDLKRLAKVVEEALEGVTAKGRQPSPQALVLAAITLAHELEVAREEKRELKERYQRTLTSLLGRVDRVLCESESLANEEPSPEVEVEVKVGKTRPNAFLAPREPLR